MRDAARTRLGLSVLPAGVLAAPRPAPACLPSSLQSKLVADDGESGDELGRSVCIDGDPALVRMGRIGTLSDSQDATPGPFSVDGSSLYRTLGALAGPG